MLECGFHKFSWTLYLVLANPVTYAMNYCSYVILRVKSTFDEETSWPQLISKLLVASACLYAASDWPRSFFTLKVFLFSIS